MINIGQTTSEIVSAVEKLASTDLKAKDDFERIVSLAVESNKITELEELAFHSRYIIGLVKIIQSKNVEHDETYLLKLNDEFRVSYMKLQSLVRLIIAHSSRFIQDIFEEKYLQLSQVCLNNLNTLCGDLSYLKLYLNDLKTKKDPE